MCCGDGGGGSAPQVQTVYTQNELPSWAEDYMKYQADERKRVFEQAKDLYEQNKEYQPYDGPRLQGFTTDQLDAFGGIRDIATGQGEGQQAVRSAIGMTGNAAQPVDMSLDPERVATQSGMGGIDAYMNPYIDQVVDRTVSEMDRVNQMNLNRNADAATKSGAFGGSRHAIVDAETQRGFQDKLGQTVSGIMASGYNNAANNMQQDRARTLQADTFNSNMGLSSFNANRDQANTNAQRGLAGAQLTGALGESMQGMQGQGLQALMQTGGMQQQFGQQNLDMAYNDFLSQQQYPFAMTGYLQQALQGQPFDPNSHIASTTTQQPYNPPPQPNPWVQGAGLGIAALGTAGSLGWL